MSDTDVEMSRIVNLSEGNPGAVTVLGTLVKEKPEDAPHVLDQIEQMNLGGPRIWLGYKDYCNQNLNRFVTCVLNRDEEMITLINERSAPNAPEVA